MMLILSLSVLAIASIELIEEFISEPKVCFLSLYNNDTKYVIAIIGVDCNASNRIVLFISFDLNNDFNGMK